MTHTADTTFSAITHDDALNMHGQPVAVETEDGRIVYGEIEVTDVFGHGPRANVRSIDPLGGGTLPGDEYYNAKFAVIRRVFPSTRMQLVDYIALGRDIPTPGWVIGANEWVEPRDGNLPLVLEGQTEWVNGPRKAADRGFPGVTLHTFTVKAIEPHTRFDSYQLMDGTLVERPVRGWKYKLANDVWMDGRGKHV